MNLGTLFKREADQLRLDPDELRKVTDDDFVRHLSQVVPLDDEVREMKIPYEVKRKQKFVYFCVQGKWYSLAWDGKAKTLIASEEQYKGTWRFVVGYQQAPTL